MPKVANIIANRLYEAGCRHAFGIPGGEVLSQMEALEQAGIRFTLVKHENPGGFMAEGTHHATGAPGILMATLGPGVANAVNVIANAWQDQVPMIFLTGCLDAAEGVTYTHQIFDHSALLKPITKASLRVCEGAVAATIDKAIAIATDGQPGPVHVDIPISVANFEEPESNRPNRVQPAPMAPASGPQIEAARQALSTAKRPIIIAGIDVLHHGAAEEVAAFAKDFNIPLLTTYKGKGILPEDHPLALGAAGLSPKADDLLLPLVAQADMIILAGYDPIEMRSGWRDPWGSNVMVVEFSAIPNTHYMHQARHSFIGDVGAGIAALRSRVTPSETWPDGEAAAVRATVKSAFAGDGSWGPDLLVQTARKALPRNTIATVDTGAHRILFSQVWEAYEPRSVLQSTALCTMGVAMPMALGYKIANPERPVVAFSGDAGMEMVLGDLATLRDCGLAVIIIVFVDESLSLIEMKQRDRGKDNLGVDFGGTDWKGVTEAMGGVGIIAGDAQTLEREIKVALDRETYTLIACPIGRKAYDGKI